MNVLVTGMELSIVVVRRVEGRHLFVRRPREDEQDYLTCVQCDVETQAQGLILEGEIPYVLCPEDAIELALELVREAKEAMKEEKKRSVVR